MKKFEISTVKYILLAAVMLTISFNQVLVSQIAKATGAKNIFNSMVSVITRSEEGGSGLGARGGDLSTVDLGNIKSTAQGVAVIMAIDQIKTPEDAIKVMLPTGVPDYGMAMGVSFDDPVASLAILANAQKALLAGLTPEQKSRFIALASMPVGISCEFCCGVGPVGITSDGSSSCGCQHNPALLSVTMWLMQNTDYSDAEILREVYRWKTLFFPKNMVDLATKISGGDQSVLEELPGMVGGC